VKAHDVNEHGMEPHFGVGVISDIGSIGKELKYGECLEGWGQ